MRELVYRSTKSDEGLFPGMLTSYQSGPVVHGETCGESSQAEHPGCFPGLGLEYGEWCARVDFSLCLSSGGFWWLSDKESACQCRGLWFDPWVGKILWRRKWQPTPVYLPGESYGQRSLVRYSPWGYKRFRHDLTTNQQQQASICLGISFGQISSSLKILPFYS